MPQVFISYRREDSAYVADTINQRLRQAFGAKSVFYDIDTIPLGTDFRTHISKAMRQCDVFLVIIGARWLNERLEDPADLVRIEIESALNIGIPVIPVLVDQARMPGESELPESLRPLRYRNAAEVRPGRDLGHHLEMLVKGVQAATERTRNQQTNQPDHAAPASTPLSVWEIPPSATSMPGADSSNLLQASPRKTGLPIWMRSVIAILVLVGFALLGTLAGDYLYDAGKMDGIAFLGAIPTWGFGIWLAIWTWRKLRPSV